jgi:hypothetical protein
VKRQSKSSEARTMTKREWAVISATTLGEWWDSPQSDEQIAAWYEVLKPFEADAVMGAMRVLLRDSPRFAPRLGEVLRVLKPAPPAFDQAWTAILPVLRNGTVLDPDVAVARIAELAGPVVAGWVASYGLRRLALEPTADPQFGGAVLKRLADSYSQMADTEVGRSLALTRAQRAIAELERRERAALPEVTG